MDRAREAGRLPILTGGSGLYFAALTEGLADIPDPGPVARTEARALFQQSAQPRCTPAWPRRTRPPPPGCARPTVSASRAPGRCGLAPALVSPPGSADGTAGAWRFAAVLLDPPRADLARAIAQRFAAMLAHGAIEEVRALLALGLDPALPAMRAHGVPELAAHLRGELTLDQAHGGSNG